MHLADLPTPSVLVERARLLDNINRMQAAATARGLRLRPHGKTHKSPMIARWQLDAGAVGITLAKVGEAEVFANAGIQDIRLAYPIPPTTSPRLLALMNRAHMSIVVDHPTVASAWSQAMQTGGQVLDVLVKVDVGYHRCGIDPVGPNAIEFISEIIQLPGLRFRGLLSHAGHGYNVSTETALGEIANAEAKMLTQLAEATRAHSINVDEISVGATPTVRYSLDQAGLTELRPGTYVFGDLTQVALGATTVGNCALSVLATVVSAPTPDRFILDAGSKTLSSDAARGPLPALGYGAICTDLTAAEIDPGFIIDRLSEEHGVVEVAHGRSALQPGDRVRVIPNHACVVTNLADAVRLTDGDAVLETLPVAARGKNS